MIPVTSYKSTISDFIYNDTCGHLVPLIIENVAKTLTLISNALNLDQLMYEPARFICSKMDSRDLALILNEPKYTQLAK